MKRKHTRKGFLRSRFLRDVARVVAIGCMLFLLWSAVTLFLTTLQDPRPFWTPN